MSGRQKSLLLEERGSLVRLGKGKIKSNKRKQKLYFGQNQIKIAKYSKGERLTHEALKFLSNVPDTWI